MPGPRDRTHWGYLPRENPWLQLQEATRLLRRIGLALSFNSDEHWFGLVSSRYPILTSFRTP
jgi:hypothetical protein